MDFVLLVVQLVMTTTDGLVLTRRGALIGAACCFPSSTALAAKDCFLDCEQNCNRVAPQSPRCVYMR